MYDEMLSAPLLLLLLLLLLLPLLLPLLLLLLLLLLLPLLLLLLLLLPDSPLPRLARLSRSSFTMDDKVEDGVAPSRTLLLVAVHSKTLSDARL